MNLIFNVNFKNQLNFFILQQMGLFLSTYIKVNPDLFEAKICSLYFVVHCAKCGHTIISTHLGPLLLSPKFPRLLQSAHLRKYHMIPKLRLQQGHADRNGYLIAFLLTTVIIGRLLVDCLLGKVHVPLIVIHGTKSHVAV